MTKILVDQKAYLKKYLRSDKDEKKKKKKKKVKVITTNVKIIDDDIDLDNIRPVDEGEFEILNATEDAPQIVGIVDERGPIDFADKRRWKIIADDGDGNVAVSCSQSRSRDIENETMSNNSGPKSSKKPARIDERDIENGNSNQTPPRKSRKNSDDDLSPPRKAQSRKKSRKRKKSSSSESSSSSSSSSSSDSSDSECEKNRKSKSKKSLKNCGKIRADEDSDLSPPRPRKRRNSGDLSPSRSRKHKDSSPPRANRYQHPSESDMSPPRKFHKSFDDSRRKRPDDFDLDPPRRPQQSFEDSRRRRPDDFDLDPPRRPQSHSNRRNNDPNSSPPRPRRRRDSDDDLSPPRRSQRDFRESRNRGNDDSDLSPPRIFTRDHPKVHRREKRVDSDLSPPRKQNKPDARSSRKNGGSDSDLSPPRHRINDSKNRTSEPQRDKFESSRRYEEKTSTRKNSRWNDDKERRRSPSPDVDRRMKKTLDGKTAGLQDAKALREETMAHKQREKELFNTLSAEVSGQGQATILRDRKTGRRRDLAAEAANKREKEERQAEIDEKYAKWGKGLKQVSDQTQKLQDDLYEMSKPLARYADDADLDSRQRAVEYAEDPMLGYIKDKQIKEGKREPDAPSYEGSFMPNRFGIKPGHRWDGVDRSNGYEKKWFEARNARAAGQEEAYKWSTADM